MRCARAKNTLSTNTVYEIHDRIGTVESAQAKAACDHWRCVGKQIAVCFGSIERIYEHMIKTDNNNASLFLIENINWKKNVHSVLCHSSLQSLFLSLTWSEQRMPTALNPIQNRLIPHYLRLIVIIWVILWIKSVTSAFNARPLLLMLRFMHSRLCDGMLLWILFPFSAIHLLAFEMKHLSNFS